MNDREAADYYADPRNRAIEGKTPHRQDEHRRRKLAQEHRGEVVEGSGTPIEPRDFRAGNIVDHPTEHGFWRHDPPTWGTCCVCGGPTCWIELDLAYTHPECDMSPGYKKVLGKVERNDER